MLSPNQSDPRVRRKVDTFLQKVWQEVEFIARHAINILVAQTTLLLLILGTVFSEKLLPKLEVYFSSIEKIELWLTKGILCAFGIFTLAAIGIRLLKGLLREIRGLLREIRALTAEVRGAAAKAEQATGGARARRGRHRG